MKLAQLEADDMSQYERVSQAIRRAQAALLERQNPEGFWLGELEADASVTAGYIPLMYFLFGWVEPERQRKAIAYVLSKQNPDGSWPTHFGGPGDLDVSIQCYFGLKLGGLPRDEAADGAGVRVHPLPGRDHEVQGVHEDLAGGFRPV